MVGLIMQYDVVGHLTFTVPCDDKVCRTNKII